MRKNSGTELLPEGKRKEIGRTRGRWEENEEGQNSKRKKKAKKLLQKNFKNVNVRDYKL